MADEKFSPENEIFGRGGEIPLRERPRAVITAVIIVRHGWTPIKIVNGTGRSLNFSLFHTEISIKPNDDHLNFVLKLPTDLTR